MSEERSPSLPWISCEEKPSLAVGTRKQASPWCFLSGSVWAKISATSAKLPSEIHIFWPLIDQPESVLVARVRRLAASEPVSGSVSPKQPSASPGAEPRQPLSASAPPSPSARSSRQPARSAPRPRCGRRSRRGRPARRSGRSRCSRGRGRRTPRRPARRGSRPRRACSPARGRSARRGRCRATRGAISLSANSRAVSEISRCSSLSWKSISPLLSCPRLGHGSSCPSVAANASCASRVRGPGASGSSAPSIADTGWISRVVEARNASAGSAQVGDRPRPLLDVQRPDQAVAGDRFEHPGVERRRPQSRPAARPRRSRRSAAPARCRRAGPARPRRRPAPSRGGSPACWRRRRAT